MYNLHHEKKNIPTRTYVIYKKVSLLLSKLKEKVWSFEKVLIGTDLEKLKRRFGQFTDIRHLKCEYKLCHLELLETSLETCNMQFHPVNSYLSRTPA